MTLRLLSPGDAALLEEFLVSHRDSSMFLRSNWRAAGLADRGGRLEGTYAAAVEEGAIVGVAAHYGNRMIALQAPGGRAGRLAAEVARATGRSVGGLVGPGAQVIELGTTSGAALNYGVTSASTNGGDWLRIIPSGTSTPATISVSIGPRTAAIERWGTRASPLPVVRGSPEAATTSTL